jgi:hypothetical protein
MSRKASGFILWGLVYIVSNSHAFLFLFFIREVFVSKFGIFGGT